MAERRRQAHASAAALRWRWHPAVSALVSGLVALRSL
jgi:hypothetical protein